MNLPTSLLLTLIIFAGYTGAIGAVESGPLLTAQEKFGSLTQCLPFSLKGCSAKTCHLIVSNSKREIGQIHYYRDMTVRKLEDLGYYQFSRLPEEQKNRMPKRPASGYVVLDGFGWPNPLHVERKRSYTLLENEKLPCPEGRHAGGAVCYDAMLSPSSDNASDYILVNVELESKGKQVATVKTAKEAAKCIANAVFQ